MTRTSAPHTAVRLLAATLALAFAASGLAQGFPGTYQAPVPQGVVTVQLTMQGERLFGQLEGPGDRFDLEGWSRTGSASASRARPRGRSASRPSSRATRSACGSTRS